MLDADKKKLVGEFLRAVCAANPDLVRFLVSSIPADGVENYDYIVENPGGVLAEARRREEWCRARLADVERKNAVLIPVLKSVVAMVAAAQLEDKPHEEEKMSDDFNRFTADTLPKGSGAILVRFRNDRMTAKLHRSTMTTGSEKHRVYVALPIHRRGPYINSPDVFRGVRVLIPSQNDVATSFDLLDEEVPHVLDGWLPCPE